MLACSYPIALLLYKLTRDEKKIYQKYFPILLIVLGISAILFYFLNAIITATLAFLFLVVFLWRKM